MQRSGEHNLNSFEPRLEAVHESTRPPLTFAKSVMGGAPAQQADRHVVIPDLHGEYRVAETIIDRYSHRDDIQFVFLGDLIDRRGIINDSEKGVYKTLDIVKALGDRAIVTMANHEWVLLAAMLAEPRPQKEQAMNTYLGKNVIDQQEKNVLGSYNIPSPLPPEASLILLEERMRRAGHLAVLQSMVPYYETDSFIATHAGLQPRIAWEEQREDLESAAENMKNGNYHDRPAQWFSMDLATSTEPITGTYKTVISGHAHMLYNSRRRKIPSRHSQERSLHGGKRIRLASTLNHPRRDPAYIWQDWDRRIVEIPNSRQ